jgi:hypothetical protein
MHENPSCRARSSSGPWVHPPPKDAEGSSYAPSRIFREEMKPLCDLCGTRHESYQAHVFAANKAATNAPKSVANAVANAVANKTAKKSRYRDLGRRKAYMRELMRKRRAAAGQA